MLDFATRDPITGRQIWVDATVVSAYSTNPTRLQAHANKDGVAAAQAVNGKHRRYHAEEGALVALAFESGGRPSEETVTFFKSWHTSSLGDSTAVPLANLWQHCSVVLQLGSAEQLLSALGTGASRLRFAPPRESQDVQMASDSQDVSMAVAAGGA